MDIMEKLLASQNKKIVHLTRGQQVEGEVVSITDKEITLDLGTKSEGVLSKRELSGAQLKDLKVGDKIQSFVVQTENESGQIVLSTSQSKSTGTFVTKGRGVFWNKFIQAQNQKSRMQGAVLEVNKGGLIVEVEGVRGFLPNSQVGFDALSKTAGGMESLIGQNLRLEVVEVDSNNNKLIFTQRGQVSEEIKSKLKEFKNGQKEKGKIVAVLPFGLVVDIRGVEGLVFISDVAWEKVEDLTLIFKTGDEIEVLVTGIDEELGRLNLSIKQLTSDPFTVLAEKFPADEVVKGEITQVSEAGVNIKLEGGVEGLLPTSKMDPDAVYEVGKSMSFLVDGVDSRKRRVNLTPFVTTTSGLIYK